MSWDELVAGALVGTARRPPTLPEAPGALGGVLGAIDRSDTEGSVLAAGAVLGLYRQVGVRLPVDAGPAPAPSPAEVRPYCSDAAAERLDAMLDGRFRAVLGEWLGLLAAADRLVPPARVPALLDASSSNRGLRGATVAVIGGRGRWLAAQNPRWAWAAGSREPDDTGAWATGSAPARRLLLAGLRATDPGAARELLASTWTTETPDDRAAFLGVLATGLSLDDEPFLEAAIDDRRKEVRQVASGLLWRLPQSSLGRRMAERSMPLVRLGGTAPEITLPDQVDPAMVRDGLVARPPAGQGERAWWFFQLVAATPLSTWGDALGRSPAELVERAEPLLLQAWAAAAARQRDEGWALALLDADGVEEPALLDAVPHERAVAVALGRVARHGLVPAVLDVLDHCPRPWGPELSAVVVERLGQAARRQGRPEPAAVALRGRLPDLAVRLDPAVGAAAAARLGDATAWWSDVVSWFGDLLTFRADMREELLPCQ